jgi:hypothetical protein
MVREVFYSNFQRRRWSQQDGWGIVQCRWHVGTTTILVRPGDCPGLPLHVQFIGFPPLVSPDDGGPTQRCVCEATARTKLTADGIDASKAEAVEKPVEPQRTLAEAAWATTRLAEAGNVSDKQNDSEARALWAWPRGSQCSPGQACGCGETNGRTGVFNGRGLACHSQPGTAL